MAAKTSKLDEAAWDDAYAHDPGRDGAGSHRPSGCHELLRTTALSLHELSQRLAAHAETTSYTPPHRTTDDAGYAYLRGLHRIKETICHELAQVEQEILTAQPDGPRPEAVLDEAFHLVREKLRDGVRMRTLYQHSTRFHEPTKEYVRTVTGYGVEIRTLAEFFERLMVFDRRVAVIPANPDRTVAVRITEPATVGFLTDTFERAWDRAEPYPFVPVRAVDAAPEVIPSIRESILKLLVQGRSDKEIARRLGISQRSLQSHVASIKEHYGAQHRLQLGYLLGLVQGSAAAGHAAH